MRPFVPCVTIMFVITGGAKMNNLSAVAALVFGPLALVPMVNVGCRTTSLWGNIGIVTVATYIGVLWGLTIALVVSRKMRR